MINPLRCFRKTITFADGTGTGAVGTVAVATTTGAIVIERGGVLCTTNLAGAATIEMGTAANTAALIAQSTATDIDAGKFWQDATPEAGVSPAIVDKCVTGNIIITVGSTAITAGVIEVVFYYRPLTANGFIN